MREHADRLFYSAVGALGGVLLGFALTPLREMTSAANLAFPFLILTIVVAELGGGQAALVTALASAASLDFFLTKPYLTLSMSSKHDLATFVGLAICGLVVAAFGTVRGRAIAAMRRDRVRLDLLRRLVHDHAAGLPAGPALSRLLDEIGVALPLAAGLVRREDGEVVAASSRSSERPVPSHVAAFDTIERLPAEGVRLPLDVRRHRVGWLDLWGSGTPVDDETRRTLAGFGDVAALMLR
jgi:hypothetical protein